MGFDSIFFLCCFLPAVLALYFLIPKGKNTVLLLLGLVFYAFGSISALALLLLAAVVNYGFGLLLRGEKHRKAVVAAGVAFDLVYLFLFKYLNFVCSGILGLPNVSLGLAAPLGMSFFLFKGISYLVDAYRDPETATKRFDRFLLYLSFFPQVTAGPISRFRDFGPQLLDRKSDLQTVTQGLRRFLLGLSKKVLLCAPLATLADGVFGAEVLDARLAWLGAVSYMLQIYFDFSGYSDMAIGLGNILGFTTPENFNYPYVACSIGDFWRRWHISLSSWFKDYLYIPLGGNRKGKWVAGLNKAIVFTLCGLWHGSAWTFLLWGLWHGLLSALESFGIIRLKNARGAKKVLGHIYTLLAVCLGFVMFRAATVSQGFGIIGAMFAGFSFTESATVLLHSLLNGYTGSMLVLSAVLTVPLGRKFQSSKVLDNFSYAALLLLFVLCLMKLASGGFAPFIYAQF